MRTVLIACLVMFAASAAADIYKCEVDGQVTFSDRPCGSNAQKYETGKPRIETGGDEGKAGVNEMAERYDRRQERVRERTEAAIRAREAAENKRRELPGVPGTCPTNEAIEQAIRRHRVVQCMTPEEVRKAESVHDQDIKQSTRLLDSGPMAVEWTYMQHAPEWPAVIRFIDGHVVGFE